MKNIKCSKLPKKLNHENSLLIDVRTPIEYSRYHIPKSFNIPSDLLLQKIVNYLNKDYTYFIVCADGSRSRDVCKKLQKLKYQVYNVKGGIKHWKGNVESNVPS